MLISSSLSVATLYIEFSMAQFSTTSKVQSKDQRFSYFSYFIFASFPLVFIVSYSRASEQPMKNLAKKLEGSKRARRWRGNNDRKVFFSGKSEGNCGGPAGRICLCRSKISPRRADNRKRITFPFSISPAGN